MYYNFYNALTIKERYSIIENQLKYKNNFNKEAFMLWRNDMSILSNAEFSKMLEINKYNQNIFSFAVEKNPNQELKELYIDYTKNSDWYNKLIEIHELSNSCIDFDNTKLSYLLRYYIIYADKEIRSKLKPEIIKFIKQESIQSILLSFFSQISDIGIKAITLEINMQREKGLLLGNTTEDRYKYFISKYENPEDILNFFDKYPVLARVLVEMTTMFIKNTIEVFDHINEDKIKLKSHFHIDEKDFIIDTIYYGLGDSHNGNKTVMTLAFENNRKILYKPKNLHVNIAFSKLCDYLNDRAPILPLKTVNSLAVNDHGYEDFIDHIDCQSEEEVKRYYTRFGYLLGLMYLLNGTDMHMENLIAHGEHPVIIDLETIVQQPTLFNGKDNDKTTQLIKRKVFENIDRIMLLTSRLKNSDNSKGIDISALSGAEKTLDEKVLQITNLNTDEIRFVEETAVLPGSQNLPLKQIDFKKYKNNVIDGFTTICNYFINNREEILNSDVFKSFKGLKVRQLLRNTNQYAKILGHSYHPDFLSDMLDREKILENMWSIEFNNSTFIISEIEDMMFNDVPYFSYYTHGLEIYSSNRNLGEFTSKTSYEYLIEHIIRISNEDILKQVSLIELAYGNYDIPNKIKEYEMTVQSLKENSSTENTFLECAINLSKKILSERIKSEDLLLWMTVNTSKYEEHSYNVISADFYDGVYGIALAMYYLYKVTNETKYYSYFEKIIDECNTEDQIIYVEKNIGYTSTFSFIHMASFLEKEDLQKSKVKGYINKYLKKLENNIEIDVDYLNGATSLVNSLIRLYDNSHDTTYLSHIITYAEKILACFKKDEVKDFQAGFAHGLGPISLIFYKLYSITKSIKYLNFAADILDKDKHLYSNYEEMPLSWCRGLTGLAISRIEICKTMKKANLDYTEVLEEIEKINDHIMKSAMFQNDCLCHGNSGLVEYFLTRYSLTLDLHDYDMAKTIMNKIMTTQKAKGKFHLKQLEHISSIGLFTGETGILFELIRLINPEIVPSVLS